MKASFAFGRWGTEGSMTSSLPVSLGVPKESESSLTSLYYERHRGDTDAVPVPVPQSRMGGRAK